VDHLAANNKFGTPDCAYQLRFPSAFHSGRGIVVPCDALGHVDLDALSESLRNAYLGARALVGRDYLCPVVLCVH